MNKEFFEALRMLEKEKGIDIEGLVEKIKNAITVAIRRDYGNVENIFIDLNPSKNMFEVYICKNVVEEVSNPINEVLLEEALKYDTKAEVGLQIRIKLQTKHFGRIAALSAKHVIKQGIRDAERNQLYIEFKQKEHQIVSALVSKIDPRKGNATVEIGSSETILPKSEQISGESLKEGDVIKIYVSEVTQTEKGPKIMISRTHPSLVKKLFEAEVPEIKDGIVEVKSIAREAGSRSKIAVTSNNPDIDAVGSCVGSRGMRVNNIVSELGGEKIDIIKYSDNLEEFISNSLAPANIISVIIDPTLEKTCVVIVPDEQLSLAIGNKGQNVRLSAKLTGWKIDIKPQSLKDSVDEQMKLKIEDFEKSIDNDTEHALVEKSECIE